MGFSLNGMGISHSLLLTLFFIGRLPVTGQTNFNTQRENMVRRQLLSRDIRDKATLQAMATVPRHKFVPADVVDRAYDDSPLSIGNGQTISQPYIVAYMTQALHLKPEFRVLEIGTGSGYQAAILSNIVDSVFSVEIVPDLGMAARKRLAELGYSNITVQIGDGYNGWPEKEPFDAIIVTAGAETVPRPLLNQLKEGGRMVIPVGPHHGIRKLQIYRRKGNKFRMRNLMNVRFVPLTRDED
jgi:protein-L-isoaspartate(D-aspartate) O-methyltransferase